jgi:hypothetical protein
MILLIKPTTSVFHTSDVVVGIAAITAIALGIYFFMDNNNVSLTSGAQHADFQGTVTGAE